MTMSTTKLFASQAHSTNKGSNKRLIQTLLLGSLLSACLWLGISIGASEISLNLPYESIWYSLQQTFKTHAVENSITHHIVLNIRVPRVLMAVLVGAALAVSGASLQGLCRNPLADPGLLGISAGAAAGAVAMILFAQHVPFLAMAGAYAISITAFAGATLATFTVYRLAQINGEIKISMFLLAGIAINALAAALISGLSFIADDQALRLISFWMMGSLANATWTTVSITTPILGFAIYAIYRKRHALNLILLGEANARFSGIDVEKVKNQLLLLNALSVGIAVAFSGIIGFIGLVVPHILRMTSDTNYRFLIVNSALLGAALMVMADISSRMIIAPAELPIGILTSLIGAPFFIALLMQQKRKTGFSL